MSIDIEKEREWWDCLDGGYGPEQKRAHNYLNEPEATRKLASELKNAVWDEETGNSFRDLYLATSSELEATRNELSTAYVTTRVAIERTEALEAQLADQRARDIRAAAFWVWQSGREITAERALAAVALDYDRLSAIPESGPLD